MTPGGRAWSRQYTSRCEGGDHAAPYLDSRGVWTIGTGCSGTDPYHSPDPVVTAHTVWSAEQRLFQFNSRHALAEQQAEADLGPSFWALLDDVRAAALLDVAYQDGGGNPRTGIGGLAGYHRMLAAVRVDDWQTASQECEASENFHTSEARCRRAAQMLLTGTAPELTF